MTKFSNSVFFKIGALFLGALILVSSSLLIFSRVFYNQVTRRLSERIRSQTETALRQNVTDRLNEYNRLMYQIVTDSELRGYFREIAEGSSAVPSRIVSRISSGFAPYLVQDDSIIALSFISDDGTRAVRDASRWFVDRTLWERDEESGAMRELISRADRERQVFVISDARHPDGASFFHLALRVWDYFSREPLGTIVATVNTDGLWRLIGAVDAESYAYDFLMLDDGRLMVYPDSERTGSFLRDYRFDPNTASLSPSETEAAAESRPSSWRIPQNAEIRVQALSRFSVYLVSVLDNDMYHDMADYFNGLTLAFVASTVLAVSAVFYVLLRRQSEDISAIIEGIRKLREGRLDIRVITKSHDKISDIAKTFNASLQRLDVITQQRDQEMLRYLRESERRRKAEVRSLQSQINSHFLFNTLNVINYAAMEGDVKTTSGMLQNLAGCLQYTLNHNLELVTVQDEVSWLKKYLALHKERSPSLFNYTIEADDEALSMPVYKLILQPFIENSILHGFSDSKSGHVLKVGFYRIKPAPREGGSGGGGEKVGSGGEAPATASARLRLTVIDDGVGMSPEKLEEIRGLVANVNDYQKSDGTGIGIENSCFRIATHYREDVRIDVDSAPGKGTVISVDLP